MVTIEIQGIRRQNLAEVRSLLQARRLYRKGTDPGEYADFQERSEAHLAIANLNLLPGIKARVLGE
jgi:hypothetical protein